MSNRIRSHIFFAILLVAGSQIVWTQTPTPPDPTAKPRIVKTEPNDVYKKWLTEDVPGIITEAEKDAFSKLTTNEERENFIQTFWDRRDPNPDTEENEYREQYYERIAYANEHFASGIPGSKTDRGRIYITWGKPDSVESRPSGGSYDRPSYEGGGSTTTYPFEIWFYRHLEGVSSGIEIEFVDRTGTGEYRIARNSSEKDALATTPGFGKNESTNLAPTYQREQDNIFTKMGILKDLEKGPPVKFSDLEGVNIDSPVIDNNPLAFDLRIDYFRQSDDRVITTFTVQTSNKELKFESSGGLETATLNILGRITTVANKRGGLFEDSVTTNATSSELVELRDKNSIYQKAVALAPGLYKVGVIVRDVGTGNKGVVNMGFTVPRYDEKTLSASSLVLTSGLRLTDNNDTGQRFVIGNTKVIPNLGGVYKQGQEVGIYMQVYNAGLDQTTLRPAVDVEYILTKKGKEILRQTEDWSGISDSGRRLTLARLLPTSVMQTGDYEVKVLIKDRVGGQVIESSGKFTITQ